MDNNQFNPMNGANSSTKTLFSYIGLGCSALGCLLVFIFSIVTCSRGFAVFQGNDFDKLGMSKWIIGVIIAAIIAIAGAVLSILSMEKGTKMSKLVLISLILAGVAVVYAIIPNATICAYNCVFNAK